MPAARAASRRSPAGPSRASRGPAALGRPVAATSATSSDTGGDGEFSRLLPGLLRRRGPPARRRPDPVAAGAPTGGPTLRGHPRPGWASTARDVRRRPPSERRRVDVPGRRRSPRPRPSPRSRLDEAYHGTTRLVEVDGKRLEVTIPAGADTGTRIRLTGKAPGGGDLFVVVRSCPTPGSRAAGADLERELPLTLEEALLGGRGPGRDAQGQASCSRPGRAPSPAGRSG